MNDFKVLTIAEALGDPKCPYCFRWVLNLGLFAIRLHHWVSSDDLRYKHDHPYWFITCILWGKYWDVAEERTTLLRLGAIRFRPANYKHSVMLDDNRNTWTLVISGPSWRQWGFWVDGKFIRREKYFEKYGHICD